MLAQPNGTPDWSPSREVRPLWPRFERKNAFAVALSLALVCASNISADAQRVRDDFYITNGAVHATALSGNTLYIGGTFSQVGLAAGGGVPIHARNGELPRGFPRVAGPVWAVVSDGSGGWYIGGDFTSVGAIPRNRIAHILADNSVSPWNPNADNFVTALAVSGTTVYAGGSFTNIGGQARFGIAALDATTGLSTDWHPILSGGGGGFPPSSSWL